MVTALRGIRLMAVTLFEASPNSAVAQPARSGARTAMEARKEKNDERMSNDENSSVDRCVASSRQLAVFFSGNHGVRDRHVFFFTRRRTDLQRALRRGSRGFDGRGIRLYSDRM